MLLTPVECSADIQSGMSRVADFFVPLTPAPCSTPRLAKRCEIMST